MATAVCFILGTIALLATGTSLALGLFVLSTLFFSISHQLDQRPLLRKRPLYLLVPVLWVAFFLSELMQRRLRALRK